MTHHSQRDYGIRASDLEREKYAHRIERANGEGRLTLAETDRRLALVYDATYRYELEWLVSDLPDDTADTPEEDRTGESADRSEETKGRLGSFAIVTTILSAVLVTTWLASSAPPTWPLVAGLVLIAAVSWSTPGVVAPGWTRILAHVRKLGASMMSAWPNFRVYPNTGR